MENILFKSKPIEINKVLKESEDHNTFLVTLKNKQFILKVFSNESSFKAEVANSKQLKKYGIHAPKLIKLDKKNHSILFEYIDAKNMAEVLAEGDIEEKVFDELFNMYRFARFSKLDLNYLPENYRYFDEKLYYMSYEIGPSNKDKNLENYGIFYWFTGIDGITHLEELGFKVDRKRLIPIPDLNKKIVLLSIMRW